MNPIVMPLDGWLFASPNAFADDVADAIYQVCEWESPDQISEAWGDEVDLPDVLNKAFDKLFKSDEVVNWCHKTKEWRSLLSVEWQNLLILPFSSTPARVAAIYLKKLVSKHWPQRSPAQITGLSINPFSCSDQESLVKGYAQALWSAWTGKSWGSLLNVTACSKELVGISVLVASLDRVPVYLWSDWFHSLLWLPGGELPFRYDWEREYLQNLLNGVSTNQIQEQRFLARWRPMLRPNTSTASVVILREWFRWSEDNQLENDSEF